MGHDVDYGTYRMSAGEFIIVGGLAAAADLFIFYLFYRSIIICVLMLLPTVFVLLNAYKKYRIGKRKWNLACEFEEMLGCVSNALRTGYSLENSFYEAKKELMLLYGESRDILRELDGICGKLKMNYTIESILDDFARRSGIDDINSFAEIVSVAKRSGGNMISIVKQTADNFHDKREIEDEIRTLIAGKKLESRVMGVMPVGMLIYLGVCNPGYMDALYGNIAGRAVMTACLGIYALSYYISKKIMSFNETRPAKAPSVSLKGHSRHVKSGSGYMRGFDVIYPAMEKSRFGAGMKKVSQKVVKLCPGVPAREACMKFWNNWLISSFGATAAALVITLAGMLFAGGNAPYVIMLAAAVAISVPYGKIKDLDKKLKRRNDQLMIDYPEVVSRMSLLIGAGSSMKGAWEKIVSDYVAKRKSRKMGLRYAYEEMRQSLFELKNGVPEALAYENFGRNIRLIPYMKFSAMLTNNLKKGNRHILEQLNISSIDAYVQRRENVKKMGEEASSKLLLPIMLQFILVLIIVMYPAIMSL